MEILKGLPVANAINEKLIEEVKTMEKKPHLAIIRVGERPDDMSYERGATKKMDKVGFECTSYTFPADIDNDTFQKEFDKINQDDNIDGILLLMRRLSRIELTHVKTLMVSHLSTLQKYMQVMRADLLHVQRRLL